MIIKTFYNYVIQFQSVPKCLTNCQVLKVSCNNFITYAMNRWKDTVSNNTYKMWIMAKPRLITDNMNYIELPVPRYPMCYVLNQVIPSNLTLSLSGAARLWSSSILYFNILLLTLLTFLYSELETFLQKILDVFHFKCLCSMNWKQL